jgi:hypothetical protein
MINSAVGLVGFDSELQWKFVIHVDMKLYVTEKLQHYVDAINTDGKINGVSYSSHSYN